MINVYNTISLKGLYADVATYFLYKSKSAILLEKEYVRLARKYAERSGKFGARFDKGLFSDQKVYELISRDLEKLYYTIVYVEPSNPILKELDRIIDVLDDLAIEAFIRDSNTPSDVD